MNVLNAVVLEIKEANELALVKLEVQGERFASLILDPWGLQGLEKGAEVELLFKESEVLVASVDSHVSARNSFVSEITHLREGQIVAEVGFDFHGIAVKSIITTEAVRELGLKVGARARWFVKSSEMTLRMRDGR